MKEAVNFLGQTETDLKIKKLEKSNTELLKQNEALVECLKKINLLHASNKGLAEFQIEANKLLNTLNK